MVPPVTRSTSTGPRLHDYSIAVSGGLTHVRPGVLAVPRGPESPASSSALPNEIASTASRTVPVPVPVNHTMYRDPAGFGFSSNASDPWGSSPVSMGYGQSFRSSNFSGGGWSLPRSSIRSVSGSRSRSGSVSKSDEEDDYVDVDVDEVPEMQDYGFSPRGRTSASRHGWKLNDEDTGEPPVKTKEDKIEEEWDGMDMEMEM